MIEFCKQRYLFLSILFLTLFLPACAGSAEERLWLEAPDWSRAQVVGNTLVGNPAFVALDGAGNVYFFFIDKEQDEDIYYPRVMALNRQAEMLWDNTYAIELAQPAHPRILWDGQEMQLFWLDARSLYNARLDVASRRLDSPHSLSDEVRVDAYDIALDHDGALVVWFAGTRRSPGLYALPPGDLAGEAALVDAEGIRPDLQYDADGTLHVSWAHHPPGYGETSFFYASYPGGRYLSGRETKIVKPSISPTSSLSGPRLGLDRQHAYLFWMTEIRTGPESGVVNANYVYLPLGQPSLTSSATQFRVPGSRDLVYEPFTAASLPAGERVLLEPESYKGTNRIRDIALAPATEFEMPIAFGVELDYIRRKTANQIAVAFFQNGLPTSYQLLSFTAPFSADPAIISDQDGHLYITWLERGDLPGFMVYFASTAPDFRQSLRSITWDDLGRVGGETIFGLVSGALFLPFVLIWIIAPMVVLGLTSRLWGEDETLTSPGTLVSLGLAIFTYWSGKLIMLPGMRDYVPFSAWLPFMQPGMNIPLQLAVPLLITLLALWPAWRFTFGSRRPSVLFLMLIYAAIDGVLTMAIYGVILFAAI